MDKDKGVVKSPIHIKCFSVKALDALNGFYVYALIDPRDNKVFYIGKGNGNRIFSHEVESGKSYKFEKKKLNKIREIENEGFLVKRLIINWGLSEAELYDTVRGCWVASLKTIQTKNVEYVFDFRFLESLKAHDYLKLPNSEDKRIISGRCTNRIGGNKL